MLSRRNIRIKVMQLLYSMDRDPELSFDNVLKGYRTSIGESFGLFLFAFKFFMDIANHAKREEATRHKKHLPSDEDRNFRAHLVNNPLVQSVIANPNYQATILKKDKFPSIDEDTIRRLYYDFAKKEEYIKYATSAAPSNEEHQKILLSLFKHCYDSEVYCDILEDNYSAWIDDRSLVIGAIKKVIRELPTEENIFKKYAPSVETTEEFGLELLKYVRKNDEELAGIIHPKLKNWDAERVAVLDMILLKLALTELIIFSSIPKKVTLNEYLDISKIYSTDKSKDFINGILDRLMKELTKSGRIVKTGRGLMD